MAGISQSKQLWHCTATRRGPAWPLGQARDVAARLGHQGQHGAREGQQALADGREAQRPDVLLDHGGAVMAFQRLELVRQARIGSETGRSAAFDRLPHSARARSVSMCLNSKAVVAMSRFHPLYEDNEIES